jgi:hypothetical protein
MDGGGDVTIVDVEHTLRRAQVYPGFRRMLDRDPDTALTAYALSAEENTALRARDAEALLAIGVNRDLVAWWCIVEGAAVAAG